MGGRWSLTSIVLAVVSAGCDAPPSEGGAVPGRTTTEIMVNAAGAIPRGLPAHMMVGLFEDHGGTWMRNSGVPWDVRYRYFTKGWVNNWGWGAYDGGWALSYFRESDANGFIPAVAYYQMNGEPGGGEPQFLAKAQTVSTMRGYFGDSGGRPTLVLESVAADGPSFTLTEVSPGRLSGVGTSSLPWHPRGTIDLLRNR